MKKYQVGVLIKLDAESTADAQQRIEDFLDEDGDMDWTFKVVKVLRAKDKV